MWGNDYAANEEIHKGAIAKGVIVIELFSLLVNSCRFLGGRKAAATPTIVELYSLASAVDVDRPIAAAVKTAPMVV